MFAILTTLACLSHVGFAQLSTSDAVPTITVQTAVPSPSASLGDTLPSQVPLPPKQAWCPSEIFCPGAVRGLTLNEPT